MIVENIKDSVYLPPVAKTPLQLKDLEIAFTELQRFVCGICVDSDNFRVQKFEDIKRFLEIALIEEQAHVAQGLRLLFGNEKMFLPGLLGVQARNTYSSLISENYFNYWNYESEDPRQHVKIISELWILSSPTTILSGMVAYFYPIMPSIAEIMLKRLVGIVEQRFELSVDRKLSPATLVKINPLVRCIEIEERNQILLGFVAKLREMEDESGKVFNITSTLVNELSNDLVVSSLDSYFRAGVRDSQSYQNFYEKFIDIAGSEIEEDILYQTFIDKHSNEIKRLLVGVSTQIANAKDESGVLKMLSELHEAVSMKISIMIYAGALLYDEKSVKIKIIDNITSLRSMDELSFEQKLLLAILPISFFSEEEAVEVCKGNILSKEIFLPYADNLGSVVSEIIKTAKFSVSELFFRKLVVAFDSPLRSYVGLGMLEEGFFEKFAPSINIKNASKLDQGCLINYWLLCQEEIYHTSVLRPFIDSHGKRP